MKHTCHALGCKNECAPKFLMCLDCWKEVPHELRMEVNRTVGLRDLGAVNATWAPWWRAQAKAVAFVAFQKSPDVKKRDAFIANAEAFALLLEKRSS